MLVQSSLCLSVCVWITKYSIFIGSPTTEPPEIYPNDTVIEVDVTRSDGTWVEGKYLLYVLLVTYPMMMVACMY